MQRSAGADIRLLDRAALRARWPWLAVDDIALGSWGARGEGWFDGPALHQRLRRDAIGLGTRFVRADAQRFDVEGSRVLGVVDAEGQRYETDQVLIAAGAWSAPLAAALNVALPVSAKKRDVFVLDSPAKLPGCPLIIDPSGVWMRPEGAGFLAGAPPRGDDADDTPLDAIDLEQFEAQLWPALAARIPAFEALRVRSAWAGYYEMNTFDHNGLVGALPGWRNAFTACGFSGHGMQHALAVGRGLASFITGGSWGAIDLQALSPERVQRNQAAARSQRHLALVPSAFSASAAARAIAGSPLPTKGSMSRTASAAPMSPSSRNDSATATPRFRLPRSSGKERVAARTSSTPAAVRFVSSAEASALATTAPARAEPVARQTP